MDPNENRKEAIRAKEPLNPVVFSFTGPGFWAQHVLMPMRA